MNEFSRLLGVGFIVCLSVYNTLFLRCSLVAYSSFNFIHYDILYSKNIYLFIIFSKNGILSSDVNYDSFNLYENLMGNSFSSVNVSNLGLKFSKVPYLPNQP